MFFKRRYLFSGLLLISLSLLGCVTFYYKEFGISGKPGAITNYFEFRDFGCGISIDTRPNVSKSLNDSTYYVRFSIYERDYCDEKTTDIFKTLNIDSLFVQFDSTLIYFEQTQFKKIEDCYLVYRFNSITIPDVIDTLYLNLHLSYNDNRQVLFADTVVTLFRFQGKKLDAETF